ncbi:MAG: hypothetical protein ACYTFQ_19005 [Planctomycetota bacterium]
MPCTEMDNITSSKLILISERARKEPKFQFTSLAHLLNEGFLKECYFDLDRDRASAPGFGDIQTPYYGEAVKVGHDTYKFSLMGYIFKKLPVERGELESTVVMAGSFRIIDCDTIETFDVDIPIYGPEHDKDGDGFPDSDETPNTNFGSSGPRDTRKRIPFMEPSEG